MNFYTSFHRNKNIVLLRGYQDGKPIQRKVYYEPTLYVTDKLKNVSTKYRTLDGQRVQPVTFESMWEARDFIKRYDGVDNFNIYGSTNYEYAFINEEYAGKVEYDPALINVLVIDIETDSSGGFPDLVVADKKITAITMRMRDRTIVLGYKDYTPHKDGVEYYKCTDEHALLEVFLNYWKSLNPDVVTGWNIEFFDIPYLVNRIRYVLGEKDSQRLSPWGLLEEREVEIRGRMNRVFMPIGVAVLDYMKLYKKFSFQNQESWALNFIAEKDLSAQKLDYSEYESLDDLYKRNHQKFIEYNIHDVDLVVMLDEKHKFIELVYAIAYDAKVNYNDTFTTVRPWDTIIHNYLLEQNIVVPHIEASSQQFDLVGGYVKDPVPGMYDWVVSFDLTSLYPHLIMQYNISPETYMGKAPLSMSVDEIVRGGYSDEVRKFLLDNNVTICPNSCVFSREKQGFLPALMEKMFRERDAYKKMMIDAKKKYEETKDPAWDKKATAFKNMQLAKKIQLNSAYGALGNKYFRWFSFENAEAITTSGQLSIKWIEYYINEYLNTLLKTENDYVIAVDTDSMYLNLGKLVNVMLADGSRVRDTQEIVQLLDRACKEKIEPYIAKRYKQLGDYVNAYQQKMHMKRENIGDKAVWTAKKHYIMNVWDEEGVRYEKPKMKMVGIEAVRSSTPKVCRDAIKQALTILVKHGREELIHYIDQFRTEFNQLSFEQVAFPRGLSGMQEYRHPHTVYTKGTPIQVRGALLYNHWLKIKDLEGKYPTLGNGDKIKFCYLMKPNPIQENVIASPVNLPKEFGLDKYIDYEMQFEKSFIEPLKKITDVLKWDLSNGNTLESFFG